MRMIMVKQNGCVMLDSVNGCFQVFLFLALGFWGEISSLKRDKKIENKSGSRSMKWKTSWFNFESWEKRDFRSAWGRVWFAIWKIYPPIVIVWIKVWLFFGLILSLWRLRLLLWEEIIVVFEKKKILVDPAQPIWLVTRSLDRVGFKNYD
jgi:hypothetical protein